MSFKGSLITAESFNALVTAYDRYWSDQYNDSMFTDIDKSNHGYGWGQQPVVPYVFTSDIVQSDHYNTLAAQVNAGLYHIHGETAYGALLSMYAQGTPILSSASAGLDAKMSYIDANKYIVADVNAFSSYSEVSTSSTGVWADNLRMQAAAVFPSYNDARYFFNAGGKITINLEATGGSVGLAEWASIFDEVGEIRIGGDRITTNDANKGVSFGSIYQMPSTGEIYDAWIAAPSGGSGDGAYAYAYSYGGYASKSVKVGLSGQAINNNFVVNIYVTIHDTVLPEGAFFDTTITGEIGYIAPAEAPQNNTSGDSTPFNNILETSNGSNFKVGDNTYVYAGYIDPIATGNINPLSKSLPVLNLQLDWETN